MTFDLKRVGYNQVFTTGGELLYRGSEMQTVIEAAANARTGGEEVIIDWAKWQVVPIGDAVPDPVPDPDPVPVPDPGELQPRAADFFALRQYDEWFKNRNQADLNAWMYDSVQCLYELGLRNGRADILADAKTSALAYVQDYDAGSYGVNWSGKSVLDKPIRNGDMKFTYIAPLYYLKTVEGIDPDPVLLVQLSDALWSMGWFGQSWSDDWVPWSYWNERTAGYSLMGLQYLARMEVPGAMERVLKIIAWLHKFQAENGFWLHSYYGHEGAGTGEAIGDSTDVLCASPWMSCIIGGALSRFNAHYPTTEATEIIHRLAEGQLAALQHDQALDYQSLPSNQQWMHSGNQTGYGCRYILMTEHRDGSLVDPARILEKQLNHWHSDKQNPEVWLCIEAAGLSPPAPISDFFTDRIMGTAKPERWFCQSHSHYG